MAVPVSTSFETQRTSDSNFLRGRARLFYMETGLTGTGASLDSMGSLTVPVDDSVFDSQLFDVDELGQGIRQHRNFGDAEAGVTGRGWKGGIRTDITGVYIFDGILHRNLDAPTDIYKTNNGKRLAQRFTTPNPGGGVVTVSLNQVAIRARPVGTPAATSMSVYSDVAGLPGVLLFGPGIINPVDSVDGFVYFVIPLAALTPATNYWLVMDTVGNAANHWEWASVTTPPFPVTEYAAEKPGAVWIAQTYALHYRTVYNWTASPSGEFVHVYFSDQKVNRVRIYGFPSSRTATKKSPATMELSWRVGGVFTAATGVTVRAASDYNEPSSATAVAGNQISTATATFWDIETDEVLADAFQLRITKTQTPRDFARLVGIEVGQVQDITDRVTSFDVSIRRDTFLDTDQARDLVCQVSNVDRYFSPRYLPTPVQITAGFRNSELRPNLEMQVEWGFPDEMVPIGTFFLDGLAVEPRSRAATLRGRDYGKRFEYVRLLEATFVSRRIEDLIEVCGNRANVSSSRMVLAQTENFVPFWFPIGSTARQEIDLLAQAAPFGTVRFDELGVMRFITFLPSTSNTGVIKIGTQNYSVTGFPDERANVLCAGEKVYVAMRKDVAGTDDATILEYDIPTRVFRELIAVPVGVGVEIFGNLALDGVGNLFATRDQTAYKINLTTLAVTATVLTGSFAGTFNNTTAQCSQSEVVGAVYYFAASVGANEVLLSLATSLAIGTLLNRGTIIPVAGAQKVQRILRWTPSPGVTDRLYWSIDRPGVPTNTFWNLIALAMVNDAVTRRGVSSDDSTTLYELRSDLTLHSRTLAGTTSIGTHPAIDADQVGVGIGFAAGRVWAVRRSGVNDNVLRVWNVLDNTVFEQQMTEFFQQSILAEDPTTGRLALIGVNTVASGANFPRGLLRVVQGPNAPVASQTTFAWNTELLESAYELTGENGGQNAILTGISWAFNPVIIGTNVTVWKGTYLGAVISAGNPLTVAAGKTISYDGRAALITSQGRPVYTDTYVDPYRITQVAQFVGHTCLTAVGTQTFGPATSRADPPNSPTTTVPQQVIWQGSGNSITATLTAHPTSPVLELVGPAAGADAVLTLLEIHALTLLRTAKQVIEVLASDVWADGDQLEQQHGQNVYAVENDYINDPTLLVLAAKELLHLLGRPQDQIRNVSVRPTPQIGLEDIVTVVEPESGVNMRFIVVGIGHSFAGGSDSATAKTSLTLLALPVASTQGLGQTPFPAATQAGPVPI